MRVAWPGRANALSRNYGVVEAGAHSEPRTAGDPVPPAGDGADGPTSANVIVAMLRNSR